MEPGYRKYPSRNDILLTAFTIPLYAAGTGRYGLRLLLALAISLVIGSLTEIIAHRIRKQERGLLGFPCWFLFPLVLPPVFPLWMLAASVFFGTLIGVAFFGGHGRQLASPVAIGWAFAALSFPAMFGFGWSRPFPDVSMGFTRYAAAVLTIDHPIEFLQTKGPIAVTELLAGNFPQTPGNAIPLVLAICGLLLLFLRAVDFRAFVSFVGTVVVLTAVSDHFFSAPPLHTLLVGNFMLAGFFVFPEHRVCARTKRGRWITGIVTGLIAFLIRNYSSFPDGVFFAVLFGNAFSALIDEGVMALKYRGAANR